VGTEVGADFVAQGITKQLHHLLVRQASLDACSLTAQNCFQQVLKIVDVKGCMRQRLEVPSTGLLEAVASASSVDCAALTPVGWETLLSSMVSAGRG
jgi:hypothetical protein